MKNFKDFFEKFDIINNDLKSSIKDYLLTNYRSDWWNNEFSTRVYDYVTDDELIGSGDPEDESTWEYESHEEAYQNYAMGGAIEYDLLDIIRQDIINHFHITNEEYNKNNISDIVIEHMKNMIDWYDSLVF